MKATLLSLVLFLGFGVFAQYLGVAPIDESYESRLYEIYKNFHTLQMSSSDWNSIIVNRNVDKYAVQKNDNLWTVSEVLFGDSNYWPKLWSLNAYIKNPHRINVGDELYVVMGSEAEAPQAVMGQAVDIPEGASNDVVAPVPLNVAARESQQDTVEVADECTSVLFDILGQSGSTKMYSEAYKCKANQKKIRDRRKENSMKIANTSINEPPLLSSLGKIPLSLPPIYLNLAGDINIDNLTIQQAPTPNLVDRYLVDRNNLSIVGRVDDYEGIPVRTSEIIVALDIPVARGTQLSLIRPLKKIQKRSVSIGGPHGYEVIVQGIIEIIAPVPNESDYFFARVKQLYYPISRESQLIEGAPSTFRFDQAPVWGQGSAQLVGMASDHSKDMLTAHAFVYINRGKIDNVREGETLQIWANPNFHRKASRKPLGNVLIIHASDNVATGFVRQLNDVAYVGDYLRPHTSLTSIISDSSEDTFIDTDADLNEEEDIFEEDDTPLSEIESGFGEQERMSDEEISQEEEDEFLDDEEDMFETQDEFLDVNGTEEAIVQDEEIPEDNDFFDDEEDMFETDEESSDVNDTDEAIVQDEEVPEDSDFFDDEEDMFETDDESSGVDDMEEAIVQDEEIDNGDFVDEEEEDIFEEEETDEDII